MSYQLTVLRFWKGGECLGGDSKLVNLLKLWQMDYTVLCTHYSLIMSYPKMGNKCIITRYPIFLSDTLWLRCTICKASRQQFCANQGNTLEESSAFFNILFWLRTYPQLSQHPRYLSLSYSSLYICSTGGKGKGGWSQIRQKKKTWISSNIFSLRATGLCYLSFIAAWRLRCMYDLHSVNLTCFRNAHVLTCR